MNQYVSVPTMASLDDDINSGTVTRRLRALSTDMPHFRAELPGDTYVIMLTARKDDFDFERGYGAGVDDYLTKGVREPELIARIHAGLHTYSLRVQLRETRAALAAATRKREGA